MAKDKDLKTPNVPPLRFPGFTDEWKKITLGEIADVTKLAGYEFTKYVIYEDEGEIIALRGLNCKSGQLVLDDVKYIDHSDLSKLTRSKLYIGDILFTYVGTVGEVAIIDKNDKYYLAPNVSRIRLRPGNCEGFVMQQLSSKKFYNSIVFPLIATSSQPALSMENVRKFVISIPSIKEQNKIAQLLSIIDERIATQNKIIEDLKKLKSAISWRIFENATLIKLGELCEVIMGQSPSSSSYNIAGYGIPLIQGNLDIEEGMTISRIYTSEPTKISLCGDLILTVRAPVGIVAKNKMEVCIGRGVCALRNKTSIPTSYIYHALDYYGYKWSQIEQGSTFSSVNGDDIRSFAIPIVDDIEHACAFLSNIDAFIKYSIDLHSNYLKQKQYLLSQMFI